MELGSFYKSGREEPLADWLKDVDVRIIHGLQVVSRKGFLKEGDSVVVVTGWKSGSGYTNTLRIITVPKSLEGNYSVLSN